MGTPDYTHHRGRPRRHNPPPPGIAHPLYRAWDKEIEDVAVFFAFGLRRQDYLDPNKDCGQMASGGWEALTCLMNELITINNYQYEPLHTRLLRNRFDSSFKKRALNQLKMTSDLPITPSENWVRKEFLDIVLSYPTNFPESPVPGACTSASTTPDRCRMWGGLEVQGITKATQAIKQHNDYNNGITFTPPLPSENFLKNAEFLSENQSTLETYNNFRAQGPDHRPATQQQVGQSQASALQPYGAQQAGGFMGGYSQGYASEQQPIHSTIHPGYHTQYQKNQSSYSDSHLGTLQLSTGQMSVTQSHGAQQAGGFMDNYLQGYASEQQPIHSTIHPDYHTQYQKNQGSYSDNHLETLQPSTGQMSATQSHGAQQAGGFTGGHSQGYTSQQQLAYSAHRTQYQENQGNYSGSQSWAMQPSTNQISTTQSYIGQPSGGNTGAHSYGYQSGQSGQGSQGGQDDQHHYYQGSGR
ncbi:hypothetical protein BELL_0959g00020 [Botrytis elliptica]|uniref:Uncharacterized protein n=1 Tax=Botrytis elliptica TaxID=278938 RepID=A0A4Z1IYF0_9HELO|nr:hypothetical protein EAE99_010704 [Botrytis elliptica]TGO66395.1 hypothetical protein BELL_0959g00020 [Botrytis elliptica]